MLVRQLRDYIIRPALQITDLYSEAAENLLVMTLLSESGGNYLHQTNGPALGLFGIEPATLKSIIQTLNHPLNAKLNERILSACFYLAHPGPDALVHNMRYGTLIARMCYKRYVKPLPDANNIQDLASYYVRYYNAGGKATVENSISLYTEHGH